MRGNELSNPDAINHVINIRKLSELDLSKNKLNCAIEPILEILSQCKSLKILNLKGNKVVKSNKHYRKLIISRCPKLAYLDGHPICKEESRRCKAWGVVVANEGSYDEADKADREELVRIRSKQSKANAERRRLNGVHHGSDNQSACSNGSALIGSSVKESIKKAFGLIETRLQSSTISWSSRRDLSDDEVGELRNIVESQRQEIDALKNELEHKQSHEEVEQTLHVISSILDIGGSNRKDNSEIDSSYSIAKNQELANLARLKQMHQMGADTKGKSTVPALKPSSHSKSGINAGAQAVDPFSIRPPIPPPRRGSMA